MRNYCKKIEEKGFYNSRKARKVRKNKTRRRVGGIENDEMKVNVWKKNIRINSMKENRKIKSRQMKKKMEKKKEIETSKL